MSHINSHSGKVDRFIKAHCYIQKNELRMSFLRLLFTPFHRKSEKSIQYHTEIQDKYPDYKPVTTRANIIGNPKSAFDYNHYNEMLGYYERRHLFYAEAILQIGSILFLSALIAGTVLYMGGFFSPPQKTANEKSSSFESDILEETHISTISDEHDKDVDDDNEINNILQSIPDILTMKKLELENKKDALQDRSIATVRSNIMSTIRQRQDRSRKNKRRSRSLTAKPSAINAESPSFSRSRRSRSRPKRGRRARTSSPVFSTVTNPSFSSGTEDVDVDENDENNITSASYSDISKEVNRSNEEDEMARYVFDNWRKQRNNFSKRNATPRNISVKKYRNNLSPFSSMRSVGSDKKLDENVRVNEIEVDNASNFEPISNHESKNISNSIPNIVSPIVSSIVQNNASSQSESTLQSLQLTHATLQKEHESLTLLMKEKDLNYKSMQKEHSDIQQQLDNSKQYETELEHLKHTHNIYKTHWRAMSEELHRRSNQWNEEHDKFQDRFDEMQFQIQIWKNRCRSEYSQDAKNDCIVIFDVEDEKESILNEQVLNDPTITKAKFQMQQLKIQDLEAKLVKTEHVRKKLHNRIQELRGNIRVYVRVRPFLENENQGNGETKKCSMNLLPDGQTILAEGTLVSQSNTKFSFDKVFPPSCTQQDVFEEVSDLIQSALDGYHVCLFSYGQTGSGKTHTMQGNGINENEDMKGIIPRAVEQILRQTISLRETQSWNFKLSVSFLEIYNEELRDLLLFNDEKKKERCTPTLDGLKDNNKPKLTIKRRSRDQYNNRAYVDGISKVEINTTDYSKGMKEIESIMKVATKARSVAKTSMNAQSSRSHALFMLEINGIHPESGSVIHGSLNLCDLAGSERLKTFGPTKDDMARVKETKNINKSLSCLGDVFTSLANGSHHVPFRNSKLTYLLQDCLSGDGKALMFVNLSPSADSWNESMCSLRFAKRVSQVELGKATKHCLYQHNGSRQKNDRLKTK